MMKHALLPLLATCAALPAAARADSVAAVAGTPMERHDIHDQLGRAVTYYISRPKAPAPLLQMIQGSGCGRVLQVRPGGVVSTLYNMLPYAAQGRFAVLAVEKPFTDDIHGSDGTAAGCGAAFNADFTAESWLVALTAALEDSRRLPFVDSHRLLVFGGSEGAVMASLLAGRDPRVTDVVAIGGSGTTQVFDFLAGAYQRCFDRTACIDDVERQVRAINAAPDSATRFAWGHPYKRWSSFFRVDPGAELVRSRARVYLAFGTADTNVPPLSQEVAAAKLLAAGRDVTVRRVPDADHGLMSPARDLAEVEREYGRALDWFWSAPG